MSQQSFGLFAGTAVNDTSSVVATATTYGAAATSHAVVVKLVRTLMIIPICLGLAALTDRKRRAPPARAATATAGVSRAARERPVRPRAGGPHVARPRHPLVPWFLIGFVVAGRGQLRRGHPGRRARPAAARVGLPRRGRAVRHRPVHQRARAAHGRPEADGVYRHQGRQVIFVGDFIDRGPQISQVLGIVRRCSKQARLGRLSATTNSTPWPTIPMIRIRPANTCSHTPEHARQVRKTVAQLAPQELQDSLEWFRSLPLCLDLDGLRVVHACWDDRAVNQITQGLAEHGGITRSFLHSACKKCQPLFIPVDMILKGKEAPPSRRDVIL